MTRTADQRLLNDALTEFAHLIRTGDARNLETAEVVREQFLDARRKLKQDSRFAR